MDGAHWDSGSPTLGDVAVRRPEWERPPELIRGRYLYRNGSDVVIIEFPEASLRYWG